MKKIRLKPVLLAWDDKLSITFYFSNCGKLSKIQFYTYEFGYESVWKPIWKIYQTNCF